MTLTRESDTETIATLLAQLDSTLKDRARIMAERDTAKKLADAMEGEAHAHIKLWGDALRRAESAEAKLAERDAENARLRDLFIEIQQWASAYPSSVFPEPDFKRANELLQAGGMSIDAVSASNMRHVLSGLDRIVSAALTGDKP